MLIGGLIDSMLKEGTATKKAYDALLGALIGFINGLFGSGGGSIAVFGLERWTKLETHKAHATAVAVILPLSIISAFYYAKTAAAGLKWGEVLWLSAGGMAGGFVGARYLKKIPALWLHKIFAVCMAVAAVRLLCSR